MINKKEVLMLRSLVREILLSEAAYTPGDLALSNKRIVVDKNDTVSVTKINLMDGDFCEGFVEITSQDTGSGKCLGSFVVMNTLVNPSSKGAGPLLYDVAIELTGKRGLTPDRWKVSSDALKIWNFYLKKRKDVFHKQLDDLFGSITPDDDNDDCRQTSAYSSWDNEVSVGKLRPGDLAKGPDTEIEEEDLANKELLSPSRGKYMSFMMSPLSKVYYKNGTPVIDELKKLGLIEFKNETKRKR
jgi:hypothetical protein